MKTDDLLLYVFMFMFLFKATQTKINTMVLHLSVLIGFLTCSTHNPLARSVAHSCTRQAMHYFSILHLCNAAVVFCCCQPSG